MKLQDYFIMQKKAKLPDERKLALFHSIQRKKSIDSSLSLIQRAFFHKKLWYSVLTLAIVFVFFGTYFRDSLETTDYRAFLAHKTPDTNIAQADQIAKILEINGEYIIEKDGKQFHNSVLFDGDLITLKSHAKVLFSMDNSTQIEINGPAQFTISQKLNGGYLLKLIDGEFIKVTSQKSEKNLTIETDKLSLEANKSQNINLEIKKVNNQLQLKNQGAALVMTTKDTNEPEKKQTIPAAKMITLHENEISKIEDIKGFSASLIAGNLSHSTKIEKDQQTLTAPQLSNSTGEQQATVLSGGAILVAIGSHEDKTEDIDIDEKLLESIRKSDEKKVPTEAQLSQISAALNPLFLKDEIHNRYQALLNNDNNAIEQSTELLALKIQNLGRLFDIKVNMGTKREDIAQAVDQLITGLGNYHLPPTKILQLKKLKNWISYLRETPKQEWDAFELTMPAHLKF